ncbi:MAG TPA: hypothetical protein VGD71_44580 [Kribbella sp.]
MISLAFEWPLTIPAGPGQVVTINGRQAKIANGNSLTINFEGYGFALDTQSAKLTDPKAESIAITKALKLVDPRDQSTWFRLP